MLAGIAFLVNAKGLFVLAACAIWDVRALPMLLAGFAIPNAMAAGWLWNQGALAAYYEQVWQWGRGYVTARTLPPACCAPRTGWAFMRLL